jgi:hypothetical protein
MKTRILLMAFLVSSAFVGCTRTKPGDPPTPASVEFTKPVKLDVTNHNWLDVTVYVVHGSQRTRLLTVTATQGASAILPLHALRPSGEIRLLAHAVGDPSPFLSETIIAKSGMTITWTLENDLKRSSLAVW